MIPQVVRNKPCVALKPPAKKTYVCNMFAWRGSSNDRVRPAKSRDQKERSLDLNLEVAG